jgi:tetratricopeptide (TPR) repeat protein
MNAEPLHTIMRTFTIIVLFLIPAPLFAQSAVDEIYSKHVCNCLDNFKSTRELTEVDFTDCFEKTMQADSALVLQEIKKIYGDTSYESGYKFGNDLVERTTISLVKDCKTYFVLIDSLRYEDYKNLDEDSIQLQLIGLNETEVSKRGDEFYAEKALLFFELHMYDSSRDNIEKALSLNANSFQALYMKAWINEIEGNYDEAISLYEKVAELTKMKSFYIFSEVAKRKKSGM